MKKAGIVTFHNALSYGAALQSYALQQFLNKNGIANDIIDYECDYINSKYKKIISIEKNNIPKSLISSLLRAGNKSKSLKLSAAFRKKYLSLSKNCTRQSVDSLADEYSVFISGSDQVWSPTCAGFDKTYLLDFAKSGQKYSYAASFGTKVVPNEKKAEYIKLLSDFSAISVREMSGSDIVSDLTGKQSQVNVDPTILLNRNDWDKVADNNVEPKDKYVFVFSVQKPKKLVDYAIKLGKEKGLKVYYLNDMHINKREGLEYLSPVGPDGFVGLIKNAEYVVTNSFHASVFSLIYHKQLIMEFESLGKRNNRSEELLARLGISGIEIADGKNPDPDMDIDWNRVERVFDEERKRSASYVLKIKESIR